MWLLNVLILTTASIAVGFILGWIASRPRRWDYTYDLTSHAVRTPASHDPDITLITRR